MSLYHRIEIIHNCSPNVTCARDQNGYNVSTPSSTLLGIELRFYRLRPPSLCLLAVLSWRSRKMYRVPPPPTKIMATPLMHAHAFFVRQLNIDSLHIGLLLCCCSLQTIPPTICHTISKLLWNRPRAQLLQIDIRTETLQCPGRVTRRRLSCAGPT